MKVHNELSSCEQEEVEGAMFKEVTTMATNNACGSGNEAVMRGKGVIVLIL